MYTKLIIVTLAVMTLTMAREVDAETWAETAVNHGIMDVTALCDSAPLSIPATPDPPASPRWSNVTGVRLTGCGPPAPPDSPEIAHVLAAHGISPDILTRLELRKVPPGSSFDASNFAGLDSLSELTVQTDSGDRPQQLADDFMRSLVNLRWLLLENEALPPFPEEAQIASATLVGGRSLGEWGGCSELRELQLHDWRVLVGSWLAHCDQLQGLSAAHMELDSLRAVLLSLNTHRSLFALELPDNALTTTDLKAMLQYPIPNLLEFRVPRNSITDIDGIVVLEASLEELDLSYNMLSNYERTFHSLRLIRSSLRKLWLDYNPLGDICNDTRVISGRSSPLPQLKTLSLAGSNISRLCFFYWSSLNLLNLVTNKIELLQFGQLPWIYGGGSVNVDLRQNPLRKVHFNKADYKNLMSGSWAVTTVYTDELPPFDCLCRNAWLARALREDRVVLPAGAHCRGGRLLRDVPLTDLECELTRCESCQCRRQWTSRLVAMHCDALGLQNLPRVPNISELHIKGNRIQTFRSEDLPITLMLVDLRDNNVSHVDAAAAAELFEILERRVWLSGNPLACDCDNWPLLGALQAHHLQVEDYENVTCSDGRVPQEVSFEQLCGVDGTGVGVWLGAGGGAVLGLVALAGALYARFERHLKVWLYARGWCLCCVREEELDEDREYDAFLSFAHGDHEFVAEQLLPGLEGERCHYKVCVHYRDWTPGELIPTQITRSVAASRRTVIVLSSHFVNSVWGLVEFRAAHVSALAEGRVRLLVVALDDTPSTDELPEELRLYLRSTTYLKWDDPWFWDKFRYALPHRATRDVRNCEEPERDITARNNGIPCGVELMLYE